MDGAFNGDTAVPKSYIRKVFTEIIDSPDYGPEEKIRAAEALAKLEGYTGPAQQNKNETMKKRVQVVQTSKFKVDPPIVGMPAKKVQ